MNPATSSRPLIESAQEIEKAARSGLFGSRSQRLPQISGSLDYGRTGFQQTIEDLQGPGPLPPEIELERYSSL